MMMDYLDKNGKKRVEYSNWYIDNKELLYAEMEKLCKNRKFRKVLSDTLFIAFKFKIDGIEQYFLLN